MSGQHAGGGRHRLPPAVLAAAGLVLVAAGIVVGGLGAADEPTTPTTPTTFGTPAPVSGSAIGSATTPTPDSRQGKRSGPRAVPGAGPPARIVVASLGIEARVVPIASEGTTLDPPANPQLLGWWSGGARAGAARGTALVTGHTVHDGGGAMDDLEQLRRGAPIRVVTPRGSIRYVAKSVKVLDKAAMARQAPRLFSQTVRGRLVLVTCEDWDGSGYRSNVVVTARPVS